MRDDFNQALAAEPVGTNGHRVRVLLVDKNRMARIGCRAVLHGSDRAQVVAETDDEEDAIALAGEYAPDACVVACGPDSADVFLTLRRMLASHPHARIVVISGSDTAFFIEQVIGAGAKAYVAKTEEPDVLVDAVVSAAKGDVFVCPEAADKLIADRLQGNGNALKLLSPGEREVFLAVIGGASTEVIAAALKLSKKTVANRASQIRAKLKVSTDVQLVRLAAQLGVIRL